MNQDRRPIAASRQSSSSDPLSNALAFLKLPFIKKIGAVVFPTVGKRPALGDDWKEYASHDQAKLKKLFAKAPHADGYGVVLPKGWIILDFDHYKPAVTKNGKLISKQRGSPEADALYKKNVKPATRSAPRVSTPQGDEHIYLADPDGDHEGAKRLISDMQGFDCKGHGKGYVIGPNGRDRKWLHQAPVRPMDELLLEVVKDRRPKIVPKQKNDRDYRPLTKAQMVDVLSHVPPDCSMDEWVGRFCAIGSNFPEDTDLSIDLADEWSRTWFRKDYVCPRYDIDEHGNHSPGVTRRDIERKLRNQKTTGDVTTVGTLMRIAYKNGYGRLTMREALDLETTEDKPMKKTKKGNGLDDEALYAAITMPERIPKKERSIDLDSAAFLDNFPEYIVEKMLPQGRICYLTARQNSGKTALIAELAICIRHGKKFFGRRCDQGKVMIIEKDDMPGLKRFLGASLLKHGLRNTDVKCVRLKGFFDTKNWTPEERKAEVDKLVEQMKTYILVVFETVTSLFPNSDHTESWAKEVSSFLGELSIRLPNTTLLAVSHSARGEDVNTFGSSLLTHNADFEIKLDRPGDEKARDAPIKVFSGKAREFHVEPFYMSFRYVGHGEPNFKREVVCLDLDEAASAKAREAEEAKGNPKMKYVGEVKALVATGSAGKRMNAKQLQDAMGWKQSEKFNSRDAPKLQALGIIRDKIKGEGGATTWLVAPEEDLLHGLPGAKS